ncbi:hypothetical protein Bbelb_079760 [Branchiostoma belcheri]|nr:hypothetical protein Bbelb_079760 [Branchiostoma belcheri]
MTVPNLLLKKKGLHLAHVNVCSLRNKTVDLEYLLSNNNVHIMGISETHLDASVRDGELQIPNYDIIRLDRNGRGGGVAFYIRNHIPYKIVTVPTRKSLNKHGQATSTCIDLVFVKSPTVYSKAKATSWGCTDHNIITVTRNTKIELCIRNYGTMW